MIGKVKATIQARRSPPNILGIAGPKMGIIGAGTFVQWIETSRDWVRIGDRSWIPMRAVMVIDEIPKPPVVVPPGGNIRMVIFHIEMPEEFQNRGSFGIVKVYAHAKSDKPHSITPDSTQLQRIYSMNTPTAMQWMIGQENTRDPMARDEFGKVWIPTQGVYMGNYVKVLREQGGFCQIEGMSAIPSASDCSPYTHPWLWHFMWCVAKDGKTINPPCGVAFFPVINPIGWRGANVGGENQTEIWIESKWLR